MMELAATVAGEDGCQADRQPTSHEVDRGLDSLAQAESRRLRRGARVFRLTVCPRACPARRKDHDRCI